MERPSDACAVLTVSRALLLLISYIMYLKAFYKADPIRPILAHELSVWVVKRYEKGNAMWKV